MAIEMGISSEFIKTALDKFQGVNRRFSFLTVIRELKFMMIMDIIQWKSEQLYLLLER